jgi:hypothetical protein
MPLEIPGRGCYDVRAEAGLAGRGGLGSEKIALMVRSGGVAMKSAVDWLRVKAIVFESDDWSGVTRTATPDAEACREAGPLWARAGGRYDTWRKGTLETAAHMQRLFDLLSAYKGGDGRHVVFSPMVLTGNPDFEAIEANGFTRYVDIGIDAGFPPPWEGKETIEKAREGMRLGIWYPEYHGRTHHYSGQRWVDVLRERADETLFEFFKLRMFGISNCSVGIEYDGMDEEQQYEWTKVGFERFQRCFGVMPDCAINSDGTEVTERVWRRLGVKARLNAQSKKRTMGEVNPENGMIYLVRNVLLEPQGVPDEKTANGFSGAYRKTQEVWKAGEPAIVSIHRKNFTSLDEAEDKTSWEQFERYLAMVSREHPGAVYLSSWEVAQLIATGVSSAQYGREVICRNFADGARDIVAPVRAGRQVKEVVALRTQKGVFFARTDDGSVRFTAVPGNYSVKLKE